MSRAERVKVAWDALDEHTSGVDQCCAIIALTASDALLLSDEAVERAAEAVHYAQGFDDYGVANDEERADAEAIARAAIRAALGVDL